ncbi:hypothetical protein TWF106_009996 [Orbilia oligospora]|uniref:Uncharacterized protein n=1 Tax=Orbilia oligospora TaxID=2813651 RepID=A0A6G1LTF7_ORBOL|nr:hypothetical protein TWF788_001327 [Orbilia oligospora]KAF3199781.1 hypothetical protein TWF679_001179 [Orbilia oligospora]KAF3212222.1 hypothetical protein TWF106_009996 [Orbilia oligospora]KAF3232429.1 hypothetical protein TWF191_000200 [Orbilia oligospora]KAF3233262.1 hypothetical protein TWF192_002460 [Orbilia oligospora]
MSPTVPTVYSPIPSFPSDDDDITSSQTQVGDRNSGQSAYLSHNAPTVNRACPDCTDVERALPPGQGGQSTAYRSWPIKLRMSYEKHFKPTNFVSRAGGITYIAFCYGFSIFLLAPENALQSARIPLWVLPDYMVAIMGLFLWNRNESLFSICAQFIGSIPLWLLLLDLIDAADAVLRSENPFQPLFG